MAVMSPEDGWSSSSPQAASNVEPASNRAAMARGRRRMVEGSFRDRVGASGGGDVAGDHELEERLTGAALVVAGRRVPASRVLDGTGRRVRAAGGRVGLVVRAQTQLPGPA